MRAEQERLLLLDLLRGLAAVLVVSRHAPLLTGFYFPKTYLAVDLFFILSGVVLYRIYSRRLETDIRWDAFVLQRVRRLYPMYICGFILGLLSCLLSMHLGRNYDHWSTPGVASAVLFGILGLPCPFSTSAHFSLVSELYPLNVVSWTLLAEILVNAAFARLAGYLKGAGLCVWLLTSLSIVLLGLSLDGQQWDAGGNYLGVIQGLGRAGLGFGLGILTEKLARMFATLFRGQRALPLSQLAGFIAVAVVISSLCLGNGESVAYDLTCEFVIFPFCVLLAMQSSVGGVVARSFGLAGEVSYPIYALHVPFSILGFAALKTLMRGEMSSPAVGVLFIGVLSLFAFSVQRAVNYVTVALRNRLVMAASHA